MAFITITPSEFSDNITKAMLSLSLVAIAFILFLRRNVKGKNAHLPLPPGPRGLPLIGSLPFIDPNLHRYFAAQARTYGPVLSLRLGRKMVVAVTSPSAAREIFKDQDAAFASHDVPAAMHFYYEGSPELLWSLNGQDWRSLRKFAVRHLLNMGSIEAVAPLRRREVRRTVEVLWERARAGEAVDVRELIFRTTLNIVTSMLWGKPVGDDEKGWELRRSIEGMLNTMMEPNVADFFPAVAALDPQGLGRRVTAFMKGMHEYLRDIMELRNKEMAAGQKRTDVLERMMKENSSQFTAHDLRNLQATIIGGSTDSNTTTMEWAMAELLVNPEKMGKVQKELDFVVGKHRVVEESDIPQLRYLNAVIKETLRLHPAAPLLVPHRPSTDCTVGGFLVPAGTAVFVNVWAIHRDPSIWSEPEEFRPERFIQMVEKGEQCEYVGGNGFGFLPFGAGRRVCAGIALAERIQMLSLGSLLHSFDWHLPEGVKRLELSDKFGLVLRKADTLVAVPAARLEGPELYA